MEGQGKVVRWGVLGTANIAIKFVGSVRALGPDQTRIVAVASRSLARAQGD